MGPTYAMTILIDHRDEQYPTALSRYLGSEAPGKIWALGNLDVLKERKLGFFCSSKCHGDLIIKAYDLAKKWRDDGVTVIGGFHSPVEQECLTILLRGKQPVILCPARSIEGMRVKKEYAKPLEEGRLLILSPFPRKERRMTSELSRARNRFVAILADVVFVAHAEKSGKIEALCSELTAWKKPLMTFSGDSNANLIALGAKPFTLP